MTQRTSRTQYRVVWHGRSGGCGKTRLPRHARALIGCLLEGHKTENDKLNQDIALSIAEELRAPPKSFSNCCSPRSSEDRMLKSFVFIRNLLELEGDEKRIVQTQPSDS